MSIQRWSLRRIGLMAATLVLAGLLVALVLDSATADGPVKTSLEVDTLGCGDLEPLWLQAQAVPSASVVPCVATLPVGWSLGDVAVNDGRSVIALHHDRAGGDAMVARLTAACDTGGAAEEASGRQGVRRYQLVERQAPQVTVVRYDVFAGGCLTTRIRTPAVNRAEVTSSAAGILGFTSRDQLRLALEQRSGGRLHLDPARGR